MKSIQQRIFMVTLCLALLAGCGTQSPVDGSTENPSDNRTTVRASYDSTPVTSPRGDYYYEESVLAHGDGTRVFFSLLSVDQSGDVIYLEQVYSEAYIESEYEGDFEASYFISKTNGQQIGGELLRYNRETDTSSEIAAWGDDGRYYVFVSTNERTEYFIRVYDENMNIVMDDIILDLEPKKSCQSLAIYDGVIYALIDMKIWCIDMEGNMSLLEGIAEDFNTIRRFAIDADTGMMYIHGNYITYGAQGLACYDLVEDYLVSYKLLGVGDQRFNAFIAPAENGFYFLTAACIQYYDTNCQIVGRELVFGEDTSYLPQESGRPMVFNFLSDEDGNLYISLADSDNQSYIYKYTLTPGKKPERETNDEDKLQLTVTASYHQPILTEAIVRYNLGNQTTKVSIDAPYQTLQEVVANSETATTKLLTKIMTNDVGDIIATGGMGLSTYDLFQTDACIDLSDYIKNSPYYDSLNKTYLEAMTVDGKLFGLPVAIDLDYIVFNQGLAQELGLDIDPDNITWSQLIEIAQQLEAMDVENVYLFWSDFIMNSLEYTLTQMVNSNSYDLIDWDNKAIDLQQDWFMQLVKDFKEIATYDCLLAPENTDRRDANYLFCFADMRNYTSTMNFTVIYPEPLFLPPFSGELNRNRRAYIQVMYSISSNSPNKDEAWAFLESLLSEDLPKLSSFTGLPLNTKAADALISEISINNFKEQCDKISDIDYLAADNLYITPELMEYINGNITLEKALENAEYSVWLRLNE